MCVSQCFYPQIIKRIPGRYVDVKPPFAVEDSKQPQVSALPERRVKKQRQTAFTGYSELERAPFFVAISGLFRL